MRNKWYSPRVSSSTYPQTSPHGTRRAGHANSSAAAQPVPPWRHGRRQRDDTARKCTPISQRTHRDCEHPELKLSTLCAHFALQAPPWHAGDATCPRRPSHACTPKTLRSARDGRRIHLPAPTNRYLTYRPKYGTSSSSPRGFVHDLIRPVFALEHKIYSLQLATPAKSRDVAYAIVRGLRRATGAFPPTSSPPASSRSSRPRSFANGVDDLYMGESASLSAQMEKLACALTSGHPQTSSIAVNLDHPAHGRARIQDMSVASCVQHRMTSPPRDEATAARLQLHGRAPDRPSPPGLQTRAGHDALRRAADSPENDVTGILAAGGFPRRPSYRAGGVLKVSTPPMLSSFAQSLILRVVSGIDMQNGVLRARSTRQGV